MRWDIQRAYCLALRWKVSGDNRYAQRSVETLDAWSDTLEAVEAKSAGHTAPDDGTLRLMAHIQAHQWAQAGEIMRTYPGWSPERLARFQNTLLKVFAPLSCGWLTDMTNASLCDASKAHLDLAALCSTMALGIFCDRPDLYKQAYDYYTANNHGDPCKVFGNGAAIHNVHFMHPGRLGQWQESGRHQAHVTLGVSLAGVLLEMAWNQGDDLYGLHNNRFLAGAEYVARSNLNDERGDPYALPFVRHQASSSRGSWLRVDPSSQHDRAAWEPIYNHYVNRKGLAAPNVARMLERCERNHWSNNGHDMVFPTLVHRRDAYTGPLRPPSGVTALNVGGRAVLSWWGSAGATGYLVQRGTRPQGPFTTVGKVRASEPLSFADAAPRGIWFYRITATVTELPDHGPSSPSVRIALPGELRYSMALGDGGAGPAAGWGLDAQGAKVRMDGLLRSGATWGAGRGSRQALALDGEEAHVELPSGVFNDLADFTVAMWACIDKPRPDGSLLFVGQDGRSCLRLAGRADHIRYGITASGDDGVQFVRTNAPLPFGRWVHLALSHRDTTSRLYVNGALSGTGKQPVLLTPHQLGDQIRMLGRSDTQPSFCGRIQDFRVYAGSLDAAAIAALAQ
jgi:heme/copper-type cytochrome/quinol oxidase subunit 3